MHKMKKIYLQTIIIYVLAKDGLCLERSSTRSEFKNIYECTLIVGRATQLILSALMYMVYLKKMYFTTINVIVNSDIYLHVKLPQTNKCCQTIEVLTHLHCEKVYLR